MSVKSVCRSIIVRAPSASTCCSCSNTLFQLISPSHQIYQRRSDFVGSKHDFCITHGESLQDAHRMSYLHVDNTLPEKWWCAVPGLCDNTCNLICRQIESDFTQQSVQLLDSTWILLSTVLSLDTVRLIFALHTVGCSCPSAVPLHSATQQGPLPAPTCLFSSWLTRQRHSGHSPRLAFGQKSTKQCEAEVKPEQLWVEWRYIDRSWRRGNSVGFMFYLRIRLLIHIGDESVCSSGHRSIH